MGLMTRLKRVKNPIARLLLLRARAALHYAVRGHLIRRVIVSRYLQATEEPRLQIGAGPIRLPGWLNTDLISGDIYLDLTRRLPLPDEAISFAFGEHVIEHITEKAADRLLRELHRILRPGGVLRLTTPELGKLIAIYEDRNPVISRAEYGRFLDEETGKPHDHACQILNDYMRLWGHRHIYDEDHLRAKLEAAGFDRIARHEPGESSHPPLRGIERHGDAEWMNRAEAFSLEAIRVH
jgi:predicted SAM-dependent methyltransferase